MRARAEGALGMPRCSLAPSSSVSTDGCMEAGESPKKGLGFRV